MTKDRKQKKKFGINITIYFTILISLVIILTIAAASAVVANSETTMSKHSRSIIVFFI